jgi:uncharacterized protein
MLRLIIVILIIYVGFLVLLALTQNKLTYFPTNYPEPELTEMARAEGLSPWRNSRGDLIGWRRAAPVAESTAGGSSRQPLNRAIVFHGNGGMALGRADFLFGLEDLSPGLWEVYLFEYPGYGARPGRHSEGTIVPAASEAVQELLAADPAPLYLLGESLGAGVACHLAARHPDKIAGMFLITPFTRLRDVAAHHYSLVPVGLIMRERYDNLAALEEYRGPVAFLFAGRDEVVPAAISRKLYEAYRGPKQLWTQAEAMHNTVVYDSSTPLWQEVSDFLLRRLGAADSLR